MQFAILPPYRQPYMAVIKPLAPGHNRHDIAIAYGPQRTAPSIELVTRNIIDPNPAELLFVTCNYRYPFRMFLSIG